MDWWIWIFLIAFGSLGGYMLLFGSGQEEHALREIESVALESSFAGRGSPTYRIAFQVADGGKRLISRMYSSGRKDKQQAVDAMNAFLAPYRPPA